MARKPASASADQPDASVSVTSLASVERDGQHFPAFTLAGDAPRKGSTIRVRLENGVVYSAKVYATSEAEGGHLVETEGLEPVTPEAAPAPPSDIVPG